MHRAEILNDNAFMRRVVMVGLYAHAQQSINMADSPKAAFVQVLLVDPRYRACVYPAWDVCGVHYSLTVRPRRHRDYEKSWKTRAIKWRFALCIPKIALHKHSDEEERGSLDD